MLFIIISISNNSRLTSTEVRMNAIARQRVRLEGVVIFCCAFFVAHFLCLSEKMASLQPWANAELPSDCKLVAMLYLRA